MPGRHVATEEPALDDVAGFPGVEIEDADPGAVDGRAKGGEDDLPLAGERLGPPVPQLAVRAVRRRHPLRRPALGGDAQAQVKAVAASWAACSNLTRSSGLCHKRASASANALG